MGWYIERDLVGGLSVSDFFRSWLADGPKANGLLLTGGTAAGKTEAFLMPLLENLSDDAFHPGL